MHICPKCEHHGRIGPMIRFDQIMDENSWKIIPFAAVQEDPLKFKDLKRYSDRLKDTRNKTGEDDAMIVAHGEMGGRNVVIAIMNLSLIHI